MEGSSIDKHNQRLADGISIPASYTAFLAPISSSKLWKDVAGAGKERKLSETPYVVMFQAANILSGGTKNEKVQEAWEFVHPRSDVLTDPNGNQSSFHL